MIVWYLHLVPMMYLLDPLSNRVPCKPTELLKALSILMDGFGACSNCCLSNFDSRVTSGVSESLYPVLNKS